jgi:hypothetical protein
LRGVKFIQREVFVPLSVMAEASGDDNDLGSENILSPSSVAGTVSVIAIELVAGLFAGDFVRSKMLMWG